MSKRAWIYVIFIILSGGVLTGVAFFLRDTSAAPLLTFALLTGLATISQLFKSEAPTHQLYHPAFIFLFAGVILLDPFLFALLVLISHAVEWAKERLAKSNHLKSWYLQPFNISMHIIVGITAQQIYIHIMPTESNGGAFVGLAAGATAALVYVVLNHLLVGQALVLARKVSWSESGILDMENLATDYVMTMIGLIVAILIRLNPWWILPSLTPLYLIYRALAVPILKQQANTDPKTGLWNADYFVNALEAELSRSARYNRPLTVVMADLDLLRNINNAYGHLGGDAVLMGVAQLLRDHLREYDIIARFGGEEFAILMPEMYPEDAYLRIENVRRAVEHADFEAPTTRKRIKATMSFGIAGVNGEFITSKEIIHHADVAVYAAKMRGRNCTRFYSEEVAMTLGVV